MKLLGGLLGGALEQNGDLAKKPHMSARIGVKLLGGLLRGALEQNGDFAMKPGLSCLGASWGAL